MTRAYATRQMNNRLDALRAKQWFLQKGKRLGLGPGAGIQFITRVCCGGILLLGALIVLASCAAGGSTASHGGPVRDYVSLVDNLRAAGATVTPTGEVSQPFLTGSGQAITVNDAPVQAYEYPSDQAASEEASRIAPDGSSIRTTTGGATHIDWMEAPHFYLQGRVLVLYLGSDAATLALLTQVLGTQIAGR